MWLKICWRDFILGLDTTEALGEATGVGAERVVLSLGDWVGNNLHVAAEVGGVGVGLGKLAVEPDGVVSGQLGQHTVDYTRDGINEWAMNFQLSETGIPCSSI